MEEFFREIIVEIFNSTFVEITKGDFVRNPVTGITLSRNDELDLIFELTSLGADRQRPERFPAGIVWEANDLIEFRHALSGWTGIARGAVERGWRSNSKATGESETVEVYSAHSVGIDLQREVGPSYVIEWVSNLPDGLIWPDNFSATVVETYTKSVGSGDAELRMTASAESGDGNRAFHFNVSGVDLYLMPSIEKDHTQGQILYRGAVDQAIRDKIRMCISFVLGKPIVYLGHTEYCAEWIPTFMRSVDAFSAGGAFFKLFDLPPYPISDLKYANLADKARVEDIVGSLFKKFDQFRFNELYWSYWYAVCAPIHAAAVHFGSLIEQLQHNYRRVMKTGPGTLLDEENWGSLNCAIRDWLRMANIPNDVRPILQSKISSLNNVPQNLLMKRLLNSLGLEISQIELNSWKHRNMAAHGKVADDPAELILNSKILRLLFHRMLAGVTCCAGLYIDYYSLGHPIRELTAPVPER